MARNREITCDVVKVLNETKVRGDVVRLQVVRWNSGKPLLEKRAYWYDDGDQEHPGKAKGLTAEDFDIILQNADEIRTILEVPNESSPA